VGAHTKRSQRGLAYLGLLFAIAIIGIMLGTVGVVWSVQIRREKEAQLLFAGDQIRAAIGRYYLSSGRSFPPSLADLLEDKRVPQIRRYLRRIYYDPMSASTDWQLIMAPGGGIMGVASTSKDTPIKQANFRGDDAAFENAACYCDWQFVFTPRIGNRRQVITPPHKP
jgi:type II secretory pathway pseudopilin PulG